MCVVYKENFQRKRNFKMKNRNGKIEKLIKQFHLGNSIIEVSSITGGLSHRMYKVVTDSGIYAVKELNPGIMKREEAYSNFVFSEKVSNLAKENGMPVISAIKLENEVIRQVGSDFFMVFPYLEGKLLKSEEITEKHCAIMGEVLAKLHLIDFSNVEEETRKQREIQKIDWNSYLVLAKKENKSYVTMLEQNSHLLDELCEKSNMAILEANQELIVSHRDLDRKNVMWQNENPFIIDWEASGYINPLIELIVVAWNWAGGDVGKFEVCKFEMVVKHYQKFVKRKFDERLDKIVYAGIYDGLQWVKYNLERSLCIGNSYQADEIELAENEIRQSIGEIKYYVSQISEMVEVLRK